MTKQLDEMTHIEKLLLFLICCVLGLMVFLAFARVAGAQETAADRWNDQEWIGPYVTIAFVQETERGPDKILRPTGKELANTMDFKTLQTIAKERQHFIRLAGREDPKSNIFVGKFNEHCTPNGFKLALAIQELKVELNGVKYLAISNFTITWAAVQITWRSQFTWEQIEPELKKAFIESGYGPPNE